MELINSSNGTDQLHAVENKKISKRTKKKNGKRNLKKKLSYRTELTGTMFLFSLKFF